MPNILPNSMISLSDEQMNSVMRAAEPLQPRDRGAFLEVLAQAPRGRASLATAPFIARFARYGTSTSIRRIKKPASTAPANTPAAVAASSGPHEGESARV